MITWFSAGKVSLYPFMALTPRITEILLWLKFWNKTSFPTITYKKESVCIWYLFLWSWCCFPCYLCQVPLKVPEPTLQTDWWRLPSEMANKKGQRAREQKEFRTRENSLSVSVTRDWKSTLFKEPEELRQMLPSLAWESVGQPRICY